jgi:farnesyl-diphosphate farnesyltransferase
VGKLLTDLFCVYGLVDRSTADQLSLHAVEFGLALQKINILRDLRADMLEGRCYWPEELMNRHGISKGELLDPMRIEASVAVLDDLVRDVVPYCRRALHYIELLPPRLQLRSFCAIPLFMALATARVCRGNPNVMLSDSPVKIPRAEAKRIVFRSKVLGWCNPYLRHWFNRDATALDR